MEYKFCSWTLQHELLLLLLSSPILIPLTRDMIGGLTGKFSASEYLRNDRSQSFENELAKGCSSSEDHKNDRPVGFKVENENGLLPTIDGTRKSHSYSENNSTDLPEIKRSIRQASIDDPRFFKSIVTVSNVSNAVGSKPRLVLEQAWRKVDGSGIWLSLNVETFNTGCNCSNHLQLSVAIEEMTGLPCHCLHKIRNIPIARSCSWLMISDIRSYAAETPSRHMIQLEVAACHRATVWCNCFHGNMINNESSKHTIMKQSKTDFQLPGVDIDKWQLKAAIHQLPREPLALEINLEPDRRRISSGGSDRSPMYHWVRVYVEDAFSYRVPVLLQQKASKQTDGELALVHLKANRQPRKYQIRQFSSQDNKTSSDIGINKMSKNQNRRSRLKPLSSKPYTSKSQLMTPKVTESDSASTSNLTSKHKIYINSTRINDSPTLEMADRKVTFSRIVVELYQCVLRENRSEHLKNGGVSVSDCVNTRWRAIRLVPFAPGNGYRCIFGRDNKTSLHPGYYLIQVYPAVRWICRGANNGCRRLRYFTLLRSVTSSVNVNNAVVHIDQHEVPLIALMVIASFSIFSLFVYWWRCYRQYRITRHCNVEESTCSTPLSSIATDCNDKTDATTNATCSNVNSDARNVLLLVHRCNNPILTNNTMTRIGNQHWQLVQQIHAEMEVSGWHVLNVQSPSIRSAVLAEPLDRLWTRLDSNIRILVVVSDTDGDESQLNYHQPTEGNISLTPHVFRLVLTWLANSRWANDYSRVFVLQLSSSPKYSQYSDHQTPFSAEVGTINRPVEVNYENNHSSSNTEKNQQNRDAHEKDINKEIAMCLMRLVPACRYHWPNDQEQLIKSMKTFLVND